MEKEKIIDNYGHLRPGTYDILSIPYKARDDLIIKEKNVQKLDEKILEFELSEKQKKEINSLLDKYGFSVGPEFLFDYIRRSIQAREYSKFIFTKSLNYILELLEEWGKNHDISKEELSFIDFSELLKKNKTNDHVEFMKIIHDSIKEGKKSYQITERILLPSLISEVSDLFVVPLLIGEPNFITNKIISEHAVRISGKDVDPEIIDGKIVLIENADPGFDWIFTREYYDLLHLTQDGYTNFFRYVKSSEYPDFKFQDRIGGKKFWVAAKYSTAWLGESPDQYIYFLTESQLERYKEVDKKLPVFIAVGTGNKAHNPNQIYLIPVRFIKVAYKIYKKYLLPFEIDNAFKFPEEKKHDLALLPQTLWERLDP